MVYNEEICIPMLYPRSLIINWAPLDKMAAISLTKFSNAFSFWINISTVSEVRCDSQGLGLVACIEASILVFDTKQILYWPVWGQIQFCSYDRRCKTCLDTMPVLYQGRFCSLTTDALHLSLIFNKSSYIGYQYLISMWVTWYNRSNELTLGQIDLNHATVTQYAYTKQISQMWSLHNLDKCHGWVMIWFFLIFCSNALMHFLEWKVLHFDAKFIELCS